MNLITFEMPHISQTAIRHIFIINTACGVTQDGHIAVLVKRLFLHELDKVTHRLTSLTN